MKKTKNFYQRFNLWLICSILSSLGVIALVNILIDPYIIFQTPLIPHFNKLKPEFGDHIRLSRYISLSQQSYPILFVGSSRINGGMKPEELDLKEYKDGYQLGITAADIEELKYYLKYALKQDRNHQIKEVILGLDFFMFTTQPNEQVDFIKQRVNQPFPLPDLLAASLSLQAIDSSYQTVIYNRQYLDYPERATTSEKFKRWLSLFLNRDYWYKDYEIDPNKLNDLRETLKLLQERNIKVSVFISPSHAADIEVIRLRGLWPTFEQLKREIVKITPVWDFSGYNSVTTEPIKEKMTYYIDNSHYDTKVGRLVLARMSGINQVKVPDDFGVLLNQNNIEDHLKLIEQQHLLWQKNHPEDVKLVEKLNQEQLLNKDKD